MNDNSTILILCTGNSCRSQIAEGYFKQHAGDRFKVHSAGTEPADRIHPLAVQVMNEDGIDLSLQSPKDLKTYLGRLRIRYLIIVCSGANETCPRIWPGMQERLFWPFDDPAVFKGTPDETLNEFRRVRDAIKQKVLSWLKEVQA